MIESTTEYNPNIFIQTRVKGKQWWFIFIMFYPNIKILSNIFRKLGYDPFQL